jgi:hypothetical protein
VLEQLMKYLDIIIVNEKECRINIPCGIQQGDIYESVSDITGTAIPLYFEYKETGKSHALKGFKDDDGASRLLYLTITELCKNDNLFYRKNQIQQYNWLSNKNLQLAYERLKQNVGAFPTFEVPFMYNNELCGRVDCVDDNSVWEFKCVDSISREHILQVGLYMLMGHGTKTFYILNILTNEKLQIISDMDRLTKMYSLLKEHKFNTNKSVMSDLDFLSENMTNCI